MNARITCSGMIVRSLGAGSWRWRRHGSRSPRESPAASTRSIWKRDQFQQLVKKAYIMRINTDCSYYMQRQDS
jgi:hypothetical protein